MSGTIICGASAACQQMWILLNPGQEDKEERARLSKIFNQGLNKITGFVLPIKRQSIGDPHWGKRLWFCVPEHLFLIPGDSPMGLRLPLNSVPLGFADRLSTCERA